MPAAWRFSDRGRFDRRGAVLALGWTQKHPSRFSLAIAPGIIPTAPLLQILYTKWLPPEQRLELISWCLGGMLFFPLLWLVILMLACHAAPAARDFQRAALTRAVMPGIACALMLAPLAMPWIYRQEIFWTQRIRFEALTPENSIVTTRLDREMADWTGRQILRALDEAAAADRDVR